VALDLPADARERLVAWREGVFGGRPDLRLVPPESLHLTLVFIGHRAEEEVGAIAEAVTASVEGLPAARLRPTGVVGVPKRGRPRLFALDLEDDGDRAAAVQAAVSDALAGCGWYEPEKRSFWPHITLARVRRGERTGRIEVDPPADEFEASEVTLYRSHLSPRGARYEAVARVGL
jgi:RNA 2',3'-cyclic 3'-phosphodiesterase